jgi:hypothetical protein
MSKSHRWLTLLVIACLTGCATQTPPPAAPTPAQIAATGTELTKAICSPTTERCITPTEYAEIGTTIATQNCAGWFSAQVLQADRARSASGALSTLGGIAGAAAGGTPYGAAVSVGASALASILSGSAASLAGSTPSSIYGLISRVEQAWLAAMPVPITSADAFALVEKFAEQCNLPNIQNAVIQALNAVPVSAAAAPAIPTAGAESASTNDLPTKTELLPKFRHKLMPSTPPTVANQPSSSRPFTTRLPEVTIGR